MTRARSTWAVVFVSLLGVVFFVFVGTVVTIFLVGTVAVQQTPQSVREAARAQGLREEAWAIKRSREITMADFTSLSDGMTYAQAVTILGREGTVMSEGGAEFGAPTIMYQWKNPNYSNVLVMFQNNRLTMKSQFGLR
jgi:hypothetical protein